jgi:hypothetical protein
MLHTFHRSGYFYPLELVVGIDGISVVARPEPYSISMATLISSRKSFGRAMIRERLSSGLILSINKSNCKSSPCIRALSMSSVIFDPNSVIGVVPCRSYFSSAKAVRVGLAPPPKW